jgi:hypothetical protein
MPRAAISLLLAAAIELAALTQAGGQFICRPTLTIVGARLSDMQPLERTWTAVVLIDASACAAGSAGKFAIVFRRLKGNRPAVEFQEGFTWLHPTETVEVRFRAGESVERYWLGKVSPCACRS